MFQNDVIERRIQMNVKRGIGVLLCCLTIMGAFSFGGLQTKAALGCDHTYLQVRLDVHKDSEHDSVRHYEVYGDEYSCPRCGYVRWENVYRVQGDEHDFDKYGRCACGYRR